ncbi:MAG: hypothetical protein AAFR31_15725 [Cyanobacteria bacterium J06627_8]
MCQGPIIIRLDPLLEHLIMGAPQAWLWPAVGRRGHALGNA